MYEIRKQYGVPAKRGGKIRYTDSRGKQWVGQIRSAKGGHLRVTFSEFPKAIATIHPTWNIEYLTVNQSKQEG